MTERTWSIVEVSAYLDGQLEPGRQAVLETDMAQDPKLRQRIEELRLVQQRVRSVPLREPPRNYLLTPSMIADLKPRRKRRFTPLNMMRLATSVVALAFVVTFGLTLQQQLGMSPAAVTEAQQGPDAPSIMRSVATEDTRAQTADEAQREALPAEAPQLAAPAPEGTPVAEESAVYAAAPTTGDETPEADAGQAQGIGGGAAPDEEEPMEAAAATLAEPTAGDDTVTPEGGLKALELPPTSEPALESAGAVPEVIPEATQAVAPSAVEAEGKAPGDTSATPPVPALGLQEQSRGEPQRISLTEWLSIGFGVATAVLLVTTIWLTRRRVI